MTKPKKGLSLQRVADRQRNPIKAKLAAAIRLLKNGSYGPAAVDLHRFVRDEKKYRTTAQYNLAKAMYRLGAYRSALHYFSKLMAKGPKSRYYKASLEWCLFISRKMEDDDAVNEVLARYGGEAFPPQYRDEFRFRLARYHFRRAVAIERGEAPGKKTEAPRVDETSTGRKSIKGDPFGDPFDDEPGASGGTSAQPSKSKPPPPPPAKKSGGISLDDDLFGDPAPPQVTPKAKAKKKKTKKKRSRRRRRAKSKKKKAPTDEVWALSAEEHTARAQRLIARVDPESRFGARAKFLEGVLLYKVGKANDALEAFKAVVRATRPGEPQANESLRQMAFFQLARTHFGAEQPSFSIFYYDKVDRDSYAWLDALYEGSWAEFRLGNYEKALGNLLTLHAPFFKDSYYPESLILKAVVYYENCRYPEAKAILVDFLRRYEPVHDELKRMTSKQQTYRQYYEALDSLRSGKAVQGKDRAPILAQVLDLALSDPELDRLDKAYREIDAEVRRVEQMSPGFKSSPLYAELSKVLKNIRASMANAAGRAVKNQLERERIAINQLIQQAIRIDIETARSEQERIESQLRSVQVRPKRVEPTFVEWTDDEKLVWPFDGEYWRDELGTYELTLAHSCR